MRRTCSFSTPCWGVQAHSVSQEGPRRPPHTQGDTQGPQGGQIRGGATCEGLQHSRWALSVRYAANGARRDRGI